MSRNENRFKVEVGRKRLRLRLRVTYTDEMNQIQEAYPYPCSTRPSKICLFGKKEWTWPSEYSY
jgi:hypothetical protein